MTESPKFTRIKNYACTYEIIFISSDHFKNSSVIVGVAMGQIPRSTERISSYYYYPRI